jgi:hypothetical protein
MRLHLESNQSKMDWRCALHGTALASPEFKVQSHFVIAIVVLGFELKALCLLAGALALEPCVQLDFF